MRRKITIGTTVLLAAAVVAASLTLWRERSSGTTPEGPAVPRGSGVDLERRITAFTAGLGKDGGYRPPTREERRTLAEGVGLLLDGRREDAERRLGDVEYGVRTLTDRATGRTFAEVADLAQTARASRGWGRVYVDLSTAARWSVQVPHPVADRDTERLGIGVLRGRHGGVLVLAGAHRRAEPGNAADVTHRRDTVFHAVCAELVARRLPGVQVHGFADDSIPEFDVVVSTGKGRDGVDEARGLARILRAQGLNVCRAWARTCQLEGRSNQQSRNAAAEKVAFLHVEFNGGLRADEAGIKQAVAALTATTAAWM